MQIEIKNENMTNEEYTLSREEYRNFTVAVDLHPEDVPYLVEQDFVLDTFAVTLLDKTKDYNKVMGVK